ncbi:Uncharacterised protein [Mycoplasma putrefaciens]|nr:Uncharacterised protein [Mycoplasma putrefaciens]
MISIIAQLIVYITNDQIQKNDKSNIIANPTSEKFLINIYV